MTGSRNSGHTEWAGVTTARREPDRQMRGAWTPQPHGTRPGQSAVLIYALAWVVAAAAAVGLVFAVFGGEDDLVSVPPVRETELADAATNGRCELRAARTGEPLNPPVDGPAGMRAAEPGFYEEPVAAAALTAAVRKGIIVIQFRHDLGGDARDALKVIQAAVPEGTIVAPNDTGMRFAVAVTAYRRLLGCPRFDEHTLDAIRLFRGRFLGSGPDPS